MVFDVLHENLQNADNSNRRDRAWFLSDLR